MSGVIQTLLGGFGVVTIPYSAVTFLLKATGADGAQTGIDDVSNNTYAITVNGNAQCETATYKWSESVSFDGTGDYLNVASTPADFGTGDFTIEGWINSSTTSQQGANSRTIIVTDQAASVFQLYFEIGTGKLVWGAGTIVGTSNVASGAFKHFAIVRESGSISIYVEGSREAGPTSYTTNFSATNLKIGGVDASNGCIVGFLEDLRLTNVARYSGASYTVPTATFPSS